MNTWDPKYQQKSKSISSVEPNYFVHFAMRYPVPLHVKEVFRFFLTFLPMGSFTNYVYKTR